MPGSYIACLPIGKKIALVQCAASAASTAGVFFGHGPSSKVSTTSPCRRKSWVLKCSKPKPGPPVVSISTTRPTPSALGLPGQEVPVAAAAGAAGAAAGVAGVAAAGAAPFAAGAAWAKAWVGAGLDAWLGAGAAAGAASEIGTSRVTTEASAGAPVDGAAGSAATDAAVGAEPATVVRCMRTAPSAATATITSAQAAAAKRMAPSKPYDPTRPSPYWRILTGQSEGKSRISGKIHVNSETRCELVTPARLGTRESQRFSLIDPTGDRPRHRVGGRGAQLGQAAQRVG